MGLFKPDYKTQHPTKWYYSEKGKKAYEKADGLFKWKNDNFSKLWFFWYYLCSLPNIQRLHEQKIYPRTMELAKVMVWLDIWETTDTSGNKTPAPWAGYPNIIDRKKNRFLDFVSRLNHSLPNVATINLITALCIDADMDFDGADSWLFDADFWSESDDICYEEFKKKLASCEDLHIDPGTHGALLNDGTAVWEHRLW